MTDWLRTLKPGDKVLVQLGPDLHEMRVGHVRGGLLDVFDDRGIVWDRFDCSGLGSTSACGQPQLVESTPENRSAWHRQRLLAQLDTVRWEDMPTERLKAVWALVTGADS